MTDAVRPYNIRLFIGGHYHRDRDLRYDGIPGILMRSNLRDKDEKVGEIHINSNPMAIAKRL